MGGADHSNITVDTLEVLREFPNIYANVVTTTANKHLPALESYAVNKENITLHINTDNIAQLMNEADFAIVTPSVTINEIFYLGVPFIAIKTAENQRYMYEYLAKHGFAVIENFDKLQLKKKIGDQIYQKDIELVDFIDLSLEEKKMVLKWRNHESIRQWMFTQDIINLEDHLNYIESLKERRDRLYFLVKQNSNPIGVIDFTGIDFKNRCSEFGIFANPKLKGMGRVLMKVILDYAFSVLKIDRLISEVLEDNQRAIQLYERYNFKNTDTKTVNQKRVIIMELKNENRQF